MQQLKYAGIAIHRIKVPTIFVPCPYIFMGEHKVLSFQHILIKPLGYKFLDHIFRVVEEVIHIIVNSCESD